MGGTVSSLVFRPPSPTPIPPSEYFYLNVDVHSPLCTNRPVVGCAGVETRGGCVGSAASCFSGESDLASLDNSFLGGGDNNENADGNAPYGTRTVGGRVNNVRNGQVYKVPAFFIRRRNATRTLLFSHGNAEDLGELEEEIFVSSYCASMVYLTTTLSLSLSLQG